VGEFDEFVLFDDRGNERLVCPDCLAVCAPQTPVRCDKDWCCCDCNQDDLDRHLAEELADPEFAAAYRMAQDRAAAERARELDDRGDDQLAAVARDIEAEARPRVEELRRERFGPRGYPTRGRA
jgi:hypothetical protein